MKEMMFEAIPFSIEVKVLVVVDTVLLFMKLVFEVEDTPFTVEVIDMLLVVVEILSPFEFTKFVLVVEITPFTFEVKTKLFDVVAMLIKLEIVAAGMLVVEIRPLILLVSI